MLQTLKKNKDSKKIKDVDAGTKLDFDTINKISINDVLKISPGNKKDEETFEQLKDQYNKAKVQLVQIKSFSTNNCRKWSQRVGIFCMVVGCN